MFDSLRALPAETIRSQRQLVEDVGSMRSATTKTLWEVREAAQGVKSLTLVALVALGLAVLVGGLVILRTIE